MKELKTYIFEGFFNNVGANNIVKPVIDAIKDASLNDKIYSSSKKLKFADSLEVILKDLEADMKKGKLVFEYTRNDETCQNKNIKIIISFKNNAKWTYIKKFSSGRNMPADWLYAYGIAFNIATDLFYESVYPTKDPKFQHSIANTIKVTEFKLS